MSLTYTLHRRGDNKHHPDCHHLKHEICLTLYIVHKYYARVNSVLYDFRNVPCHC